MAKAAQNLDAELRSKARHRANLKVIAREPAAWRKNYPYRECVSTWLYD